MEAETEAVIDMYIQFHDRDANRVTFHEGLAE